MKKLFVLFATVTLLVSVQSCKQKPADDSSAVTEDTAAVTPVPADTTATATPAVPAATDTAKKKM